VSQEVNMKTVNLRPASKPRVVPSAKRAVKNTLNDLDGKEWIGETTSVWVQKGLGLSHDHTRIEREHPAPFSFQDVARLIRFFTKRGMKVLDPFAGVASTLKACALHDRNGVGIELIPHWVKLARERLVTEVPAAKSELVTNEVLQGDVRRVLDTFSDDEFDFIVTSPPYWNILSKIDHKAKSQRIRNGLATKYSDDPSDLGNIATYKAFLDELCAVFRKCQRVLRAGRYMCIIVSDFRHKSRYYAFHSDLHSRLDSDGLTLKGIKILYQRHKQVFPYGYPFAYVPNIHHQYILIFQKDK
jgi:DNA modification methylase